MDRTLRKVKGTKVSMDGTVVSVLLETVDGTEVIIDLLPEMIMEFILSLLSARTEAWVKAEGGVPGDIPGLENPIRMVIPAVKLASAEYPDKDKRLVQILTESGTIFEFLLPAPDPASAK
ncbi:hypothetical protein GOZ90_11630 [Agrobacterium vitis]|uniref:Uncharacterized protein n=1 Tax=Agrobacterium vitis TaxID=373 RepID=A0A6L6VIU1_AGRVI|nr:hypothetical protein [Agrobacterium vitis]MUZ73332.1 hypothetical protein [Agrobacterium vitis]